MSPSEIINALGGTFEVARMCEVQPPSVSEWRRTGIPRARLMYLRLARPDVFAQDRFSTAEVAEITTDGEDDEL